MSWRPDEAFLQGLDFFSDAVVRLPESAWQQPSPCAGWRALDVLGHVGTAVSFGTALLQGKNPTWDPADPAGAAVVAGPRAWWSALVGPAREAVQNADLTRVMDSPAGRRSIGDGLSFPAVDLFVHAWDLARSADADVEIPTEAIDFAHSFLDPIPDEQKRSPRVFAQQIPVPAGATTSQSFIAWTGRDPAWPTPS